MLDRKTAKSERTTEPVDGLPVTINGEIADLTVTEDVHSDREFQRSIVERSPALMHYQIERFELERGMWRRICGAKDVCKRAPSERVILFRARMSFTITLKKEEEEKKEEP